MTVSYSSAARSARRMSWFLLFLIGVALTVTLYFVKTHAQSAKRDVRDLTRAIASEEAGIRVLRAELAYLESPTRLSELNEIHLKLGSILPEQERSTHEIEELFPLKVGAEK
ncbi:MAG: hypothetical protein ABJN22_08915 [Litorimonas sp.]